MPRAPAAAVPPPTSLKQSSSMFLNRTPIMSPRLSPRPTAGSTNELPMTAPHTTDAAPRKPARTILRAAESGKGSLLPDFSSPPTPSSTTTAAAASSAGPNKRREREAPNRVRTRSSPSLKLVMNLPANRSASQGSVTNHMGNSNNSNNNNNSGPILPTTVMESSGAGPKSDSEGTGIIAKQSLRRRTTSYVSDDEDGYGGVRRSQELPYRYSGSHRRSATRRVWFTLQKLLGMKLGHFLQILIVLSVTVLVWESHHKALFAAQQLAQFKEEESLLLLHLQKIEQQSIQLHENLNRLAKAGGGGGNGRNGGGGDSADAVDFDLIRKQTQQLHQMEEELNHEVRTLQARIQQSARSHIIQEFGEGPVQIVLDLDFGLDNQGPSRISILLWHDTPHAAWTWLEQIGRHVWDGADFSWQQAHVIDAIPKRQDPVGGKIEFIEQTQHRHEAWTVGLKENDETGGLAMYINLQDNNHFNKLDTCVGKVIDGFDALQRLLEVSRSRSYEKTPIQIKTASALHVTKREGVM